MIQKKVSSGAKILIMVALALLVATAYTIFGLRFSNAWLLHYQLVKRIPKLIVIALTAFSIGSVQSTITRIMDPNAYETLLTTLVASFDNANTSLIIFSVIVLIAIAFVFRRDLHLLDVLTLGKDKAINLGVDYDKSIRHLLLAVTLYMTVATALVGPLAFLGLIIANLSRQLMQTYRHSLLITASVLFGMTVLLGGQFLVERVFSYNVPVSVFITTGGGIYFLYLLIAKKKPY
ncbi:MAG: iron chelate uptake ABC transporter family permease subunit [Treponema sp.]|nr:iron chelate uptake ABC transporter family permease subunit [Treponema sp.]